MPSDHDGQLEPRRAPAAVAENTGVWRRASNVAHELHLVRDEARRDFDACTLHLGSQRLEPSMVAQRRSATLVDDSGRHAHLAVAERGNVLLEKVDEPTLLLKQREELQGGAHGSGGRGVR